jgi:uridine kinase
MQHARLDAIYYCPHHPHAGFEGENKSLKISCECRKPKPGMILQAAREHSIQLKDSYIVGDSFRDIQAGKSAGVITVGVRTGNGCKDAMHPPDYMFDTLLQAAEHICNQPNLSIIQYVTEKVEKSTGGYILIGGNSRSGKSTLTSDLKIHLHRIGIHCTVYRLDDHIKPHDERSPEEDYLGRFRFADAEHHLIHFLHGANKPKGIIIVEGVPALASEKLRSNALLSIHCRIDEKLRKQRIQQYYRFKGLSDAEIDSLYHSRTIDEYQPVEILAQYADIITDEYTGDPISG